MAAPYIQGLIHDSEGHSTQFILGPGGYKQWGWTGRGPADYGANVAILTAMEEAAERVGFFEYPDDQPATREQP